MNTKPDTLALCNALDKERLRQVEEAQKVGMGEYVVKCVDEHLADKLKPYAADLLLTANQLAADNARLREENERLMKLCQRTLTYFKHAVGMMGTHTQADIDMCIRRQEFIEQALGSGEEGR